ncbi:hypothetical protein [Lapillicoccus sp.]|uniref:hypothetical protein n=1 Tax=Lapillicoccus sp. TaxID=1909287 RepID=UPI003982F5D8
MVPFEPRRPAGGQCHGMRAVAVKGVHRDQRDLAGGSGDALEPMPVHLRRWFRLPDLRDAEHLIDELLQAGAPQERLGAVAGAVAQARDPHPGLAHRPQGRRFPTLSEVLPRLLEAEACPDRLTSTAAGTIGSMIEHSSGPRGPRR